ncbi:MAG TPA: MFS transporter [Thermoanaerobaculia bacterium]
MSLGWVSFLTDIGSEMIFPLLPLFLASLGGAPAMALGWIEGTAESTSSALKIVSGRMADRLRRRKPLVVAGYSLSSAIRPLMSLAGSWVAVLVFRFVDRIGKGVRSAPRDALIASVTPADRRGAAYGLHRAFDNAGAVAGPLIAAGLMAGFALPLRTVFALTAIPGALAVAVLLFTVRERPRPDQAAKEVSPGARKTGPLPAAFWRIASVVTLFTLAASSDSFLLLKARDVGIPIALIPVLWAFSNAVRAGFSRWGGGLSDRLGRRTLLLSAWSLYAVCYAAFSWVTAPIVLTLVIGVYSLYAALSEGTERALVADLVSEGSRGRAFGWLHGMTGLAALPASAGFGWIWQTHGSKTAFLVGASIAATAVLALLVEWRVDGPAEQLQMARN